MVAAHPEDADLVACHAFLLANDGRFAECVKFCAKVPKAARAGVVFYEAYAMYRAGRLGDVLRAAAGSSDPRLLVLAAQARFRMAENVSSRSSPFSEPTEAVAEARETAKLAAEAYAALTTRAGDDLDTVELSGNVLAALSLAGRGAASASGSRAALVASTLEAAAGKQADGRDAELQFNAASGRTGVALGPVGAAAAMGDAARRLKDSELEMGATEEEAEEACALLRAQAAAALGTLGFVADAEHSSALAAGASSDEATSAIAKVGVLAARSRSIGGARGPDLFAGLRAVKAALALAAADPADAAAAASSPSSSAAAAPGEVAQAVPRVTASQAAALRAARAAALTALSRATDAATAADLLDAVAPGAGTSPAARAALAARDAVGSAGKRSRDAKDAGGGLGGVLASADAALVLAAAAPILAEAAKAASPEDWTAAVDAARDASAGRGDRSGLSGPSPAASLDGGPLLVTLALAQLQRSAGAHADAARTLAMPAAPPAAAAIPVVVAARLAAARASGDAGLLAAAEDHATAALDGARTAMAAASGTEGATVEGAGAAPLALAAALSAHFAAKAAAGTDAAAAESGAAVALRAAADAAALAPRARAPGPESGPAASRHAVAGLFEGAARALACLAVDAATAGSAWDGTAAIEEAQRLAGASESKEEDDDAAVDALLGAGIPSPDEDGEADAAPAASGAGGPPLTSSVDDDEDATAAGAAAAAASSGAGGDADEDDTESEMDVGATAPADAEARSGKSREAIVRRRRRKREEHVSALKAEAAKMGVAVARLDPERWIPKSMRGKRGRQRRKGKGVSLEHGGTQGAGSFDTSLDARATAAARFAAAAAASKADEADAGKRSNMGSKGRTGGRKGRR